MPVTREPRRLLVVTPWANRWEIGNSAGLPDDYYFITELTKRGYELHWVAPRSRISSSHHVEAEGYHHHTFPDMLSATQKWPSIIRRPVWVVGFAAVAAWAAVRVGRMHRPDVVLGHTHLSAIPTRLVATYFRVPSIVKLFGVENLDRRDWSNFKYLRKNFEQLLAFHIPQDAWIVLNDGTGGAEATRRHVSAQTPVYELPNGVNVEWGQSPGQLLKENSLGSSEPIVLYLARLTSWKRPDVFLRCAATIRKRHARPVQFVVAGDGPARQTCETLAETLGVADVVRFLGPIPHAQVGSLLHFTTVLVSTNMRSNAGIPTCEALTCGVPVVTFDVGLTHLVVRDGYNGIVVPDGNIDALADAVCSLLDDETLRARLSANARSFAQQRFISWEARIAMEHEIVSRSLSSVRQETVPHDRHHSN